MTKYAIIINEVKFGTVSQFSNKLFDTEKAAQSEIDNLIKEYVNALQKLRPQDKYKYEKIKRVLFETEFYHNEIFENGKLAFYIDILPFEIDEHNEVKTEFIKECKEFYADPEQVSNDQIIKDMQSDYESLIDLRNRIKEGTDDDTTLYEEDSIVLDHTLDLLELLAKNVLKIKK